MKNPLLIAIGLLLLTSCENDDTQMHAEGEIIFSSEFDNVATDNYNVIDARISGETLEVTIGAGGCDGESWTAEMYGSEVLLTVFPATIPLRLALKDEELCEAYIQKTFFFDLTPVIETYSQFFLNIEGLDETIEYVSADNTRNLEE